jgi:hypothetical protein
MVGLSVLAAIAAGILVFRYFIPHSLPADAVASLHGELGIEHDYLTGTIYNGSRWKISKVVVRLSIYPSPPSERDSGFSLASSPCSPAAWQLPSNTTASQVRDYSLQAQVNPLSVGEFKEKAGLELAQSDYWGCQIVAASGVR